MSTGQKILNFLVGIAAFIGVMIIAYGGLLMLTAAGNVGQIERGKNFFWNVLIGMIIVLAGWLVIDTVMKYTFEGSPLDGSTRGSFGPWNELRCVNDATLRNPDNPDAGRPTPGGGTDTTLPPTATGDRITRTNQYRSQLCQYAQQEGVGAQCNHLQAIMGIESNGNPSVISPKGAVGLMQIMPDTARVLDPSLAGLSNAQITERLKDPNYNMQLGVKLYARDYQYYGGDFEKVTAAYNGGRLANNQSRDCPGLMRWQCVWDSPGCYGTANTNCTPNTGYKETRNYVTNVRAINNQLGSTP